MEEPKYWNRFWRRRMSRRGIITSAALGGAGRAAAAVVGCGSSNDKGGEQGGGATNNGGNQGGYDTGEDLVKDAVDPYDARRQLTAPPGATGKGGYLRYQGFDAVVLDRFDPHQTQFGP